MRNRQVDSQEASIFTTRSSSVEETLDFGHHLGELLKAGDVVALVGELGSGKTWLAKGIAFGLGVPEHEYVNSPAFDIVHEYSGVWPVYHIDFYRLEALSPEDYLWLEEYFQGDGVCIIEWADKFIDRLVDNYLRIELAYSDDSEEREIVVQAVGEQYHRILEGLKKQ